MNKKENLSALNIFDVASIVIASFSWLLPNLPLEFKVLITACSILAVFVKIYIPRYTFEIVNFLIAFLSWIFKDIPVFVKVTITIVLLSLLVFSWIKQKESKRNLNLIYPFFIVVILLISVFEMGLISFAYKSTMPLSFLETIQLGVTYGIIYGIPVAFYSYYIHSTFQLYAYKAWQKALAFVYSVSIGPAVGFVILGIAFFIGLMNFPNSPSYLPRYATYLTAPYGIPLSGYINNGFSCFIQWYISWCIQVTPFSLISLILKKRNK